MTHCSSTIGAGHACGQHLPQLTGARQAFRARLPEGHVLATFMDEHGRILGLLDQLEVLARRLAEDPGALAGMGELARHLIGAEPHHQREEQVLFPALVALGLAGPPAVMTSEHVELRRLKHAISDHADRGDGVAAAEAARELVAMLREHIAKEDNVLYPMAFAAIPGVSQWDELRARCDAIGYCCSGH